MAEEYVLDTSVPTITAHRFPSALNGWHLTPVTVSFRCTDNGSITSCSEPTTLSTDGAGQTVSGTAVDATGLQATVTETVNIDLVPPLVTVTEPANLSVTTAATIAMTGSVSDALSGLASVLCNGIATTVVDGQVSCTVALRPGRNDIVLSARDVAGHSASAAVTVFRHGTVTRLTLTPQSRRMLVNEVGTLSLLDNFGAMVTGAEWTTSDPSIVSLSADDPPVLTALAPGSVNVTARKPGLSTVVSVITVGDGETHPEGSVMWTVPPLPTPNTRRDPPIYAHRIGPDDPDAFIVETNVSTWERTVRPVTSSGAVQALIAAPGIPLLGDAFGGLVAGVEPQSNTCRAVFGEFEQCYTALVRFVERTSSNGRTVLHDGTVLDTVAWTSVWSAPPSVSAIALANGGEVGVTEEELLGLGDNGGINGSSVMNLFGKDRKLPPPVGTANDIGRNLPTDVRRCDEINASLAPARSWPPPQ